MLNKRIFDLSRSIFKVFCNLTGSNSGGQSDTRAAPGGRKAGAQETIGKDVVTDTTSQTSTTGDALRAKPVQSRVYLFGRSGTRGRFYYQGTGNTSTARAL